MLACQLAHDNAGRDAETSNRASACGGGVSLRTHTQAKQLESVVQGDGAAPSMLPLKEDKAVCLAAALKGFLSTSLVVVMFEAFFFLPHVITS